MAVLFPWFGFSCDSSAGFGSTRSTVLVASTVPLASNGCGLHGYDSAVLVSVPVILVSGKFIVTDVFMPLAMFKLLKRWLEQKQARSAAVFSSTLACIQIMFSDSARR